MLTYLGGKSTVVQDITPDVSGQDPRARSQFAQAKIAKLQHRKRNAGRIGIGGLGQEVVEGIPPGRRGGPGERGTWRQREFGEQSGSRRDRIGLGGGIERIRRDGEEFIHIQVQEVIGRRGKGAGTVLQHTLMKVGCLRGAG